MSSEKEEKPFLLRLGSLSHSWGEMFEYTPLPSKRADSEIYLAGILCSTIGASTSLKQSHGMNGGFYLCACFKRDKRKRTIITVAFFPQHYL